MFSLSLTPVTKEFFIRGLNASFVTRITSLVTVPSGLERETTNHCLLLNHHDLNCHLSLSCWEQLLSTPNILHPFFKVSFRNDFQIYLLIVVFFFFLDSRAFLCLLTQAFVGKTVILADLCPYFQLPWPLYLATLGWYSAILIHIYYVIYNVHISFKDIFSLHKTLCAIPILQTRSLRFMEVKYTELYFYRKMQLV